MGDPTWPPAGGGGGGGDSISGGGGGVVSSSMAVQIANVNVKVEKSLCFDLLRLNGSVS